MTPRKALLVLALMLASCLPAASDLSSDNSRPGRPDDRPDDHCSNTPWRPGWLEIHHIDAGPAMSTLIIGPTGQSLLVDAGEAGWDSSEGATCIGAYVRSVLGRTHLDTVVLSHFHLDHVGMPGHGGLWHMVHAQGFTVGKLLHRDVDRFAGAHSTTLTAWRDYLRGDEARALHPEIARKGTGQVTLGENVRLAFVAVDGNGDLRAGDFATDSAPPDENDYSIAFVLRMGRLDYFSGGDLSGKTKVSVQGGYAYHDMETRVASLVKDVDVLRVSHHGSAFASNKTFLAELDPRVSIIQVADGNQDGHPAQSTVDRLLTTSTLYLTEHGDPRTDVRGGTVAGHVVVRTSDGIDYTVNGDANVASDPPRVDADGDGYFQEADPDDGARDVVPLQSGGCDSTYELCR